MQIPAFAQGESISMVSPGFDPHDLMSQLRSAASPMTMAPAPSRNIELPIVYSPPVYGTKGVLRYTKVPSGN